MDEFTVLLAEDNEDVLHLITIWLKKKGFRVLAGSNGKRALEVSRAFHGEIDILLTDIEMPEMTGIELARQIEEERPRTKILMMSGDHSYADCLGADQPFLCKPFGLPELSRRLEDLKAGASAGRLLRFRNPKLSPNRKFGYKLAVI